ncbi:MAG TPA: PKD domain-containing protein [Dehalococcoidia bacterium]|nr:PKD domain-containing protein [Dehalococcoidia bacterium]
MVSFILAVTASAGLGTGLMVTASNPPPDTEWETAIGGSYFDYADAVQQATDGGYIVVGTTYSSGNGGDFYVVKADASGNVEWEKTLGGSEIESGRAVDKTADGGYIIAGKTASYGTGGDFYVVKTDASGNVEWEKIFGGSSYEEAFAVQQTADGGYIIAGDTDSYGAGRTDVYLVKTDASGNVTWDSVFGASGFDHGYAVDQTTDGGYIIAGTTTSYGAGGDFYLVKADASGNLTWDVAFGGSEFDCAFDVTQTTDGGYILVGETLSFGAGSYDFYVVKADASGNAEWEKTFGGSDWDDGLSIEQTTDGGYIIAGNSGSFSVNGDGYLVKTDASGNIEWDKTVGGSDYDCVHALKQTADGGYIVAGETYSYGAIGGDVFLAKVSAWTNTPVGSNVTVSLESSTITFPDVSESGTTTATTSTENPGGPTPSDYYVIEGNFVEITTTANYTGPVTVGLRYDESQVSDEESLRLFHWNGSEWEDVTTSVDTVENIVYGQVASLSWFFIGEPAVAPVADAGGPYLVQVGYSLDLDGSASYHPDGTIVSYDWSFGDNTTGTNVTVSHTYTAVNIYNVDLTVTDNRGVQDSDTTMVVAYDPESGSATGGGWFWSAQGNLKQDPESEGKATFGFVVKYKQEAAAGNLEFQYHVGDINLKSTDITWLVVSSPNANFQGEATINGEGLYTFRVLAKDGDKTGGQPDEFTIKIWQGTDTEADPIYQALNAQLGGGNIIIHDN